MLKRLLGVLPLAVLALALTPSEVDAYGAGHVGYTHVGPNGAYHTGTTVAAGPGGAGAVHTTTVAGGGTSGAYYHSGYSTGSGVTGPTLQPSAGTGYRPPTTYAPSYSGSYSYIR
jgi:hypothetical protein